MKGATLFICLIISLSSFYKPYPKVVTVRIMQVLDGNTMVVEDSTGEQWKIAFTHIDAPEQGQEGFDEASDFLRKRILGKKVRLVIDEKDRWGMLRGRVYVRKKNIEKTMLENGLAWLAPSKNPQLLEVEEAARKERLGIWSYDDPQPPWIWRRNMTKQAPKES